MVMGEVFEGGGCFVRWHLRPPSWGLKVPLQCEVLPHEFLDIRRFEMNGPNMVIRDAIIANVSLGYITHAFKEETCIGVTYRVATDWEPIEISFVPVGADPDAGLQRDVARTFPCTVVRATAAEVVDAAAAAQRRMDLLARVPVRCRCALTSIFGGDPS
jgi:hypothetical protein